MKLTTKQKERLIKNGWNILDDYSARKHISSGAFYDLEKKSSRKFEYGLIDESGSFNPTKERSLSKILEGTMLK
tara:strand:+ start:45697 stop:45918 length:222 start_codon:yes stop_codon:yes gene_type:complete